MLKERDKHRFQLGYAIGTLAIESAERGEGSKDSAYWRKELDEAWECYKSEQSTTKEQSD